MKPKRDKDLIAHISLNGAAVLDRILDGRKLPFLGGGPIVGQETIQALLDARLIVQAPATISGYKLTQKGKDVCRALWGNPKDTSEDCPWPMITQDSEYNA